MFPCICLSLIVLFVIIVILWGRNSEGKHLSDAHGYIGAEQPTGDLLPPMYYEKTRMFTQHEKECYTRLCNIASDFGYIVFAKVPLCFLVAPRPGVVNYTTTLGSLGFTYIDFVLCDVYLKTSLAITLDLDVVHSEASSVKGHPVDDVLQYCGVDVLRTAAIDGTTRAWIAHHSESSH